MLPLLSIAIPTWNRAPYLRMTLEQLRRELSSSEAPLPVEILVSDNCSEDDTQAVVESMVSSGLPVRYLRNQENIGSDHNIAQCFNLASGRYVLLLGDDDILADGALQWLVSRLEGNDYGVVFLRPYGYDKDFRRERPGEGGVEREFSDAGQFLATLGALTSLISVNVICKQMLEGIDARQFCGSNLVQVHLVFRAALSARRNLYTGHYRVACKRNNSGGYDFSQVFVERFGEILDRYRSSGLSAVSARAIENRMLIGYYPFYVWRQKLAGKGDLAAARERFRLRFAGRLPYVFFVAPIFSLPRPLAAIWGALAVVVGRLLTGDMRRGIHFARNKLFSSKAPA